MKSTTSPHFTFLEHPHPLAIIKLSIPQIPLWALRSTFLSFTMTPSESSLICEQYLIPHSSPDIIKHELNRVAFQIEGVLEMSMVGVLAGISVALALEGVPIFVVSTFDTDWIIVEGGMRERMVECMKGLGHVVK